MPGGPPSLSRSAFIVLLTLTERPRHGLGIIDEIEARTGGEIRMGPGTLYGTIRRLVEQGCIEETGEAPVVEDDDPRRRYYRATPLGLEAWRAERQRLRRILSAAESIPDATEGRLA